MIPFNELVQCSRCVIHPGHHAAHINPITYTIAALLVARFDFSPQLIHPLFLSCQVHMAVKHPAVWFVIGFVKRNRVVTQDNMLPVVRGFFIVLYVLKKPSNYLTEFPGIVIPPDQHFLSFKRPEIKRPFGFFCSAEITHDKNGIARFYCSIPTVNNRLMHFVQISKRPLIKRNNVRMSKMQIRNIIISQ